jgi:hypothetical protein
VRCSPLMTSNEKFSSVRACPWGAMSIKVIRVTIAAAVPWLRI